MTSLCQTLPTSDSSLPLSWQLKALSGAIATHRQRELHPPSTDRGAAQRHRRSHRHQGRLQPRRCRHQPHLHQRHPEHRCRLCRRGARVGRCVWDQKSKSRTEPRPSKKLSEEKVGKAGQIVFLNKLFADRFQRQERRRHPLVKQQREQNRY